MLSAYAFALGVYPDTASNIESDDPIASSSDFLNQEKEIRSQLGLNSYASGYQSKNVPVNTDIGFLYWKDPSSECPILYQNLPYPKTTGVAASSVKQLRDSAYPSTYSRVQSKIGGSDKSVVESLMARNLEFDDETLMREFGTNLDDYVYYLQAIRSNTKCAEGDVRHSHFFADKTSYSNLLRSLIGYSGSSMETGENIRFEIFENNKKHYVRATRDGQAIALQGSQNGVIELDAFLAKIYPNIFFGSIQDTCVGQEDEFHEFYPVCSRGNLVGYTTQVEKRVVETAPAQIVRRAAVQETVPIIEETKEKKVELIDVGLVEVVQRPVVQQYVQPVVQPVVQAPPVVHETKVIERQVPVIEEKIIHEVEVRDRPVPVEVKVPVIEEKVVVHEVEKLVAEQPTHIHHIDLEAPEQSTGLPVQFHEEIESEGGWPWWLWLLPLLCCIPLLAWLLCRKPKPKPVVKPKQPMAPVAAKRLAKPKEKEVMHVKTEEKKSPEKKYVIERKVVDEGDAIEHEIEKELRKSRAARETRTVRQTAVQSAAPQKGRTRRIKTIKKFGQVIGKEEQILDEDGNVISSKKIGLDENEYTSEKGLKSHLDDDPVAAASSSMSYERRSKRGYSSGSHAAEYRKESQVQQYSSGYRKSSSRAASRSGYRKETSGAVSRSGYQKETSVAGSGVGYEGGGGTSSYRYRDRSPRGIVDRVVDTTTHLGSGRSVRKAVESSRLGTAKSLTRFGDPAVTGSFASFRENPSSTAVHANNQRYQYESKAGNEADYGRYSPGHVSRSSRRSYGGSGRYNKNFRGEPDYDDEDDDRYYI